MLEPNRDRPGISYQAPQVQAARADPSAPLLWSALAPSTALPRSPSSKTGTIAGSEVVLYQDPEDANAEHHGGSINFGNDGKIYITTGEHFDAAEAQDLTKPRRKILRLNPDGTVPTDNPFYDGAGPNYDAIWALGLRNPGLPP